MARSDADAREVLRARKVLTVDELARMLGRSVPTARRQLKEWRCLTSFNRNGKFYALPDVPDFDEHGLWHHGGVGFSKHGNLMQTIVKLVDQCWAGLTAAELGELLRMNVGSFLSRYARREGLMRRKRGRAFVYVPPDYSDRFVTEFNEQRERLRRERLEREKKNERAVRVRGPAS